MCEELCHLLLCQFLLHYELFHQFSYCCVISFHVTGHWLMRGWPACDILPLVARVAHVIKRQLTPKWERMLRAAYYLTR